MHLPFFTRSGLRSPSIRRRRRSRPNRRAWAAEDLEGRLLLAAAVFIVGDDSSSPTDIQSLPFAIPQANLVTGSGGSLIEFSPTYFNVPRTITLARTLVLSETGGPEVISGPGAGLLTVSGGGTRQVFVVDSGVAAAISDLTISDGEVASSLFGAAMGAGLLNEGGTVTLSGAAVTNNRAAGATAVASFFGGAGRGGGLAQLSGKLTLSADTVSDNTAAGGGGGAGYSGGPGSGGGLYVAGGTVNVVNSTFSRNAANGGSGGAGQVFAGEGLGGGNGSAGAGGGLLVAGGTVTLVNSTLVDNIVQGGAGGAGGNGSRIHGRDGNAGAATGGGLAVTGGALTLDNTIVALNFTAGDSASDISGTVAGSFNLIGNGGSGGLIGGARGNQVGVPDPGIYPLAQNGGLTETMALYPSSPAIDAGSVALAVDPTTGQPLTTDQRGPGFVRTNGGTVDIGAYEHQPPPSTGGGGSGGQTPTPQPARVVSVAALWGTEAAPLETASDGLRLLPAGRNTDLPWLGIDALTITLNQPETLTAGEVSVVGMTGMNYGPVTISGSGTSYTIAFARPIEKADRVTISISGTGLTSFTRRLDVLPGDFFDTGVVTSKDLTAIKNEWKGKHGATPTLFGEITGDGTVTTADSKAARKFLRREVTETADVRWQAAQDGYRPIVAFRN